MKRTVKIIAKDHRDKVELQFRYTANPAWSVRTRSEFERDVQRVANALVDGLRRDFNASEIRFV
jgi:hypothetical protein